MYFAPVSSVTHVQPRLLLLLPIAPLLVNRSINHIGDRRRASLDSTQRRHYSSRCRRFDRGTITSTLAPPPATPSLRHAADNSRSSSNRARACACDRRCLSIFNVKWLFLTTSLSSSPRGTCPMPRSSFRRRANCGVGQVAAAAADPTRVHFRRGHDVPLDRRRRRRRCRLRRLSRYRQCHRL